MSNAPPTARRAKPPIARNEVRPDEQVRARSPPPPVVEMVAIFDSVWKSDEVSVGGRGRGNQIACGPAEHIGVKRDRPLALGENPALPHRVGLDRDSGQRHDGSNKFRVGPDGG